MLEDLMKNIKLDYVQIEKGRFGNNIVKPMIISTNIENLRYFHIYNDKDRVDITLDIS